MSATRKVRPVDIRKQSHGPQFRSVRWDGQLYEFTPTQAAIISLLWQLAEQGTPVASGDWLIERAGSDVSNGRVDVIFQGHPFWQVGLVRGRTRGTYGLNVTNTRPRR